MADAPSTDQFCLMLRRSKLVFAQLELRDAWIAAAVDLRPVRWLDYRQRATFEFAGWTLDSARNALGGGGR